MRKLLRIVGLVGVVLLGGSAQAADVIYVERVPASGHLIPRLAVDMADGTWADKIITGAGSTTVTAAGSTTTLGAGSATTVTATAPVQGTNLFNSHATGAANTAVTATISAVAAQRVAVHSVQAFCSAGTASLTITDGGTTKWATPATAVGTTQFLREWATGLTAATNSAVVVTLGTCGVGNTGTLTAQVSQF